jgi:hypothetical protein
MRICSPRLASGRWAEECGQRSTHAVSGEKLDLVGLAVHGQRNAVDKVVKGAILHP